jgi:hypothetical protein
MSVSPPPATTSPAAPTDGHVATLFTNNWTDLRVAAEYAGVERSELEQAVAEGEVRGLTSHPLSPGDWMVPLGDVEAWLRRRSLARAVLA